MSDVRKQYEEFDAPAKKGSEVADDASSPESIPEIDRPPLRKIDHYIRPEIPCLTKRITVAFLSCMGFIIMFGMRTSMSFVKVELNNTWTNETLAAVDSAIFWGYFVTQIPGGLIAAAYPANVLFGAAIGSSCILNLCIPAVYENPNFLIVVKILQGLVEGVTYPACHGIMRHWAPPLERSRLATLAFSGCYAGVMFSMPISGALIGAFGPLSPFYFYGVVGILWYLSWIWLVFEKPAYHTCIEAKELMFIQTSLGDSQMTYEAPTLRNTPWKAFFTSMPCYAIFVANFCRSWNFYLLVIFQAIYFRDAFGTGLTENALLGPLPHFFMTVVVQTGGILADKLRKNGILTTTQVRKLFNCGGFGMEATFFLIMAYSNTVTQGMTALSIGVAFSGFAISGFNVNHLDIAPKYASILMGISNGIGTIAGCICPQVVHKIVPMDDGQGSHVQSKKQEWKIVFIISALIHYVGIIFYGIFASGELQPWADSSLEEKKQWNQMNEAMSVRKSPSKNNGLLQRQPSGAITNYGAMETPLESKPPRPTPPPRLYSQEAPTAPSEPYPAQSPHPAPIVSSGNPFRSSSNPFRQEPVQPIAQDTYMHGTIDDRTY
ncbi:vesicular glutamate transporter 1 [Anoplophora glabripennis]|uniref:vesicular glutamate transporter 1 n=1 Tax=Anoplophora glabripennis TaxID=217634 RepID=UPI000C772F28|nr:vesicular glutamate transporter 1 [Anoplophora glabripennis]